MHVTPFRIHIDDTQLLDLRQRLERVRWPDRSPVTGWRDGADFQFMQRLSDHWRNGFDWRAQESQLNELPQFTAELGGLRTHFIHQRGVGPHPYPLVLGHGWPNTGFDLRRIIPLLADPGRHGGDPADAFDVVVPSLPGHGFSDRPTRPGHGPERVADDWRELMTGLGYERFGAHSGDWGAAVAIWMAKKFPDRLSGMHLNFLPGLFAPPLGDGQPPLTAAEEAFVHDLETWFSAEGGYHRLQSTRPQTPAYALADSPTGLAAWIVEKLRAWSSSNGDVENAFSLDDVLTDVSLYWFTNTIGSTMRFYYENNLSPNRFGPGDRVTPHLGFAGFGEGGDPVPPREWLERVFTVTRYEIMDRGGHFGDWEAPEALAGEIREFFRPLRS